MSQQTREPNTAADTAADSVANTAGNLQDPAPAHASGADRDELQAMWGAVAALLDDVTVAPSQHPPAEPPRAAQAAPPPAQESPPQPVQPVPAAMLSAAEQPAAGETPAPPAAPAAPDPGVAGEASAVTGSGGPGAHLPAEQPAPAEPPAPAGPLPLPPWEQPAPPPPAAESAPSGAQPPAAPAAESAPAPAAPAPAEPVATPQPLPATQPAQQALPGAAPQRPVPETAAGALPAAELDNSAVSIRGRSDGLTIEIGEGPWPEIVSALTHRLENSGGFFRGAHVALELGERPLNEQDLKTLADLIARHEIILGVVRTSADRTFHSAIALGLAVIHESAEGATLAAAQVAAGNTESHSYYVYRGSLRSGQILDRADHVVIVGDVNPGAQVISDGDILVWGRLRGMAHAGANGNSQSVIAALDLDPIQLRIDTVIAATPGGATDNRPRWYGGRTARRPEIARLVDSQLVIEAWDEAKVHGANILKRRRD